MDGISNAQTRMFVLNPIAPKTAGGSFTLANGQPGLFSLKGADLNGLKAVNSIVNKKGEKFVFEVGTGVGGNKGGLTTKNFRSADFDPKQVKEIIYEPSKPATTPTVILGYDGFDVNKKIVLVPNAPSNISLTLKGEAVGYYGLRDSETTQNFTLVGKNDPECSEEICPPIAPYDTVKEAIEQIKGRRLRADLTLGDLVDVRMIASCDTPAVATASSIFYDLIVQDNGDSAALAAVQAQYPGYEVVFISRTGVSTTYQLHKEDESGLPSAFVKYADRIKTECGATCPSGYTKIAGGNLYNFSLEDNGADLSATLLKTVAGVSLAEGEISAITATGSTLIGAASITESVTQDSTDGSGTGATFNVTRNALGVITSVVVIAGGEDHEVGDEITILGSQFTTGVDSTNDVTVTVTALATFVESITKIGQDYGVGNYALISADTVSFTTLVAAYPSASVNETPVVVADVCKLTSPASFVWTEGIECDITTEKYFIDLQDTDCGDSRLAELQAAYPQYTIVEEVTPAPAACRRRYSTTVMSNAVCDDCYKDSYSTEAPASYMFSEWSKTVVENTNNDCLVGIAFTPKEFKLCQEKQFAGAQASLHGQIELNVSGGEDFGGNLIGYAKNNHGPWAVTRIGRAFDGTGWGDSFCATERITSARETADFLSGDYIQDKYKGMETKLEPCKQYDTVSVRIAKDYLVNNMSGVKNGEYNYIFVIESGSIDMYKDFFYTLASGNPEVEPAF